MNLNTIPLNTGLYDCVRCLTIKINKYMVEKLKKSIELPNWSLAIIVTLLIASFTFTYNFSSKFSSLSTKVDQHELVIKEQAIDIKALEQTKADKELINNIYITLERIENKLDNHISINSK
jgi:hypothetical protein